MLKYTKYIISKKTGNYLKMRILKDKIESIKLNDNQIVLDIEATGVHKDHSYIHAIGLLFSGEKYNFIQVFIEDKSEEKDLLEAIAPYIYKEEYITFNGKNFDLPFINYKLLTHGLDMITPNKHLDLYQYIRTNKAYLDLENYSLQDLERYLDIERDELIFSNHDLDLYSVIDEEKIKRILLHNKYDVINTYECKTLVEILETKKTFTIPNKYDEKYPPIELKLEDLAINKEMMRIRLTSDYKNNLRYDFPNMVIEWKDFEVKILSRIEEGYIQEGVLGLVFRSSKNEDLIDESKYKLPKPYILVYTNLRLELENIKNIVKEIFRKI